MRTPYLLVKAASLWARAQPETPPSEAPREQLKDGGDEDTGEHLPAAVVGFDIHGATAHGAHGGYRRAMYTIPHPDPRYPLPSVQSWRTGDAT